MIFCPSTCLLVIGLLAKNPIATPIVKVIDMTSKAQTSGIVVGIDELLEDEFVVLGAKSSVRRCSIQ